LLASKILVVAGSTGKAGAAFQSFRARDVPVEGMILPIGKVPDLLDFRTFSRK
jgi:hypothetical protein